MQGAAERDSEDFICFKELYDKKYFLTTNRGLYYETYKRLIATAITKEI